MGKFFFTSFSSTEHACIPLPSFPVHSSKSIPFLPFDSLHDGVLRWWRGIRPTLTGHRKGTPTVYPYLVGFLHFDIQECNLCVALTVVCHHPPDTSSLIVSLYWNRSCRSIEWARTIEYRWPIRKPIGSCHRFCCPSSISAFFPACTFGIRKMNHCWLIQIRVIYT